MDSIDYTPKLQQEIEAGSAFISAYKKVSPGIGDRLAIQLTIDGSKYFVFNIRVFATIAFSYFLAESTVAFPGTEITPKNLNRGSSTTPTHRVFFQPSIYTAQKLIIPAVAAKMESAIRVGNLFFTDIIGKKGVDYVLELENKEGGGDMGVQIIGYEGV